MLAVLACVSITVACDTAEQGGHDGSYSASAPAQLFDETAPEVKNLKVETNYQTKTSRSECVVTFDQMEGEYRYVVELNGKKTTVLTNRYAVDTLVSGKEYTVKVTTVCAEMNPSPAVEKTFVYKSATKGFKFETLEDGTLGVHLKDATDKQITGEVVFPDTADRIPVTKLLEDCFKRPVEQMDIEMGQVVRKWIAYVGHDTVTTKVVLPQYLTEIGYDAMEGCNNLQEVVIPDTVKTIAHGAFYRCNLTAVRLPEGVVLGNNAFGECSALEEINLEAASQIGSGVVNNTKWLNDRTDEFVVVNGYLIKYNGAASRLTAEDYPDNVREVCGSAFDGCTQLEYIELPAMVTKIGQNFISNKSDKWMPSIVIPSGATLENRAFKNAKLNQVVISEGVTEISDECFYQSTFTELNFPSTLTRIGDSAFDNCQSITGKLALPAALVSIGDRAFSSCRGITGELILPAALKSLGERAFSGCTGIVGEVTFPVGFETIGSYAFQKTGVTKIVANGLTHIGDYAFVECESLAGELIFPDTLKAIGSYAFQKTGVTKIVANGLEQLGEGAFSACRSLTTAEFSDKVTVVPDHCFEWCYSLKTLVVGKIESIGASGFSSCSQIEGFDLSNCLTIGDDAFSSCNSIKEVVITDKTETIGDYAFRYCKGLTKVDHNAKKTSIGLFARCSALSEVSLGSNVTAIGEYTFSGCNVLENVVIPKNVTEIGVYAFNNCSMLTSVEFAQPTDWRVDGEDASGEKVSLFGETAPDLTDSSVNAEYLVTDYSNCKWQKELADNES